MELNSPRQNTLKISTKRGYILIDPDAAEDAKVIILSDGSEEEIAQTDNLVVFGPGDYEASGILIKGTRPENETMYSIDAGDGRILLVTSTSISKLADEDDFDAVVVRAVGEIGESALTALSTGLVVVYGDEQFIPDSIKANRANKINLKKKDELASNVVYLEKK